MSADLRPMPPTRRVGASWHPFITPKPRLPLAFRSAPRVRARRQRAAAGARIARPYPTPKESLRCNARRK
jgi:hypothetical protein